MHKEVIAREKSFIDIDKLSSFDDTYDQEWRVYLAAKEYIKQGIYIVPLRKNSKYLPEGSTNINYGSASRNLDVIEKWFHPSEGRFKGWNVGIATGREDGIFAVDVDRHGKTDGFVTLDKLIKEHSSFDAPSQKTPNNGLHYLFMWQDHAISSTNKIGPGIDTRGGAENACKGHIVVFPSIVNGKEYQWCEGGEINEIPRWIMERMGVSWKATQYGGKGGNGRILG